jgi:diguanylate cyclase (GGDEF)-like protein
MPPAPIPAPTPDAESRRLTALRDRAPDDDDARPDLAELAGLAARLSGCPVALVTLVEAETVRVAAGPGLGLDGLPREATPCGHAVTGAEPWLVVPDLAADPRFAETPLVAGGRRLRFYAGLKLLTPDGQALGTLCVLDHVQRRLPEPTLRDLGVLARAVSTALELRRALRQGEATALTDAPTGLANHRAFLAELSRAIARQRRHGPGFSLLRLELDGATETAGAALLPEVATALSLSLREEDIAASLGGNGFAALLLGGDGSEVAVASERVRQAVKAAMAARGWAVKAAIGAACFLAPPEDEAAAMAIAGEQLRRARSLGGKRVQCVEWTSPQPRRGEAA